MGLDPKVRAGSVYQHPGSHHKEKDRESDKLGELEMGVVSVSAGGF